MLVAWKYKLYFLQFRRKEAGFSSVQLLRLEFGVDKKAQAVKALAATPTHLSLIPRIHTVEERIDSLEFSFLCIPATTPQQFCSHVSCYRLSLSDSLRENQRSPESDRQCAVSWLLWAESAATATLPFASGQILRVSEAHWSTVCDGLAVYCQLVGYVNGTS